MRDIIKMEKQKGINPKELRQYRLRHNLTQAALAEKLGVSANTVARWERGVVAIPVLLTLAIKGIADDPATGENKP